MLQLIGIIFLSFAIAHEGANISENVTFVEDHIPNELNPNYPNPPSKHQAIMYRIATIGWHLIFDTFHILLLFIAVYVWYVNMFNYNNHLFWWNIGIWLFIWLDHKSDENARQEVITRFKQKHKM